MVYIAFTLWILRRSRRAGWCWWLILSPLLCGYVADVIRKDYLQLLLMVPILTLCARQRLSDVRCFAVMALLVLELFLHEAFIFWGAPLPLLVMLTSSRSRVTSIGCAAVVVFAFLLQSYWHGDAAVTEGIVASWQGVCPRADHMIAHSFGGLDWELMNTIQKHFRGNFYDTSIGWWQAAERVLVFVINAVVVTQFAGAFSREAGTPRGIALTVRVTRVYLLLAICLLPMFTVLSCDYGRIYLYLTASTVMACMMLPPRTLDRATGWCLTGPVTRLVSAINAALPLSTRRYALAILLIFAADSTWGFTWSRWFSQTIAGSLWLIFRAGCTHLSVICP